MIKLRYFIVDDDPGIRAMLSEIIEDEDLGDVAGEAEDGSMVSPELLTMKQVDILLIDLLMPERDGIETVREIYPYFHGKVIIISQVESKDIIGEAYSFGIVEYYITKPINRNEVVNVLKKVNDHLVLEKSIRDFQQSLNVLNKYNQKADKIFHQEKSITVPGKVLLSELGIAFENGSKDLLDILEYLSKLEKEKGKLDMNFPPLKEIFHAIVERQKGDLCKSDIQKEIKASEQRVRRVIHQALIHIVSLGLTDYSNPKFENYASKFFDFAQVRKAMIEMQDNPDAVNLHSRINVKKFIQVLYYEAKLWIENEL